MEFLWVGHNLEHVLAVLLLLARAGDIGSTYLVTPKLKLEANPIARKGRWPFAIATLAVCLIPYYSTALGMMAIAASLLVTASNLSKGWLMRALGEDAYLQLLERAARSTKMRSALGFLFASAGAFALAGVVLLVFSEGPDTWAYWFAVGMLIYAGAVAFHGTTFIVRLYRRVAKAGPREDSETQ
jgi:hypothetical protein